MEKTTTQTQRIIDNHGNITQDGDIIDLKGSNINIGKLSVSEEKVITNHFFKNYFEFRSRKGKSSDITIFKLVRGIFYSISILFLILSIGIIFLARNNIWTTEHAINSIIFTFCISLVLTLATFAHRKIENEFDNMKVLKLRVHNKGRIYFLLDCIYLIIMLLAVIFI